MKNSILFALALLVSTPAFATTYEYLCHPGRSNASRDKYILKVSANGIQLGYSEKDLKRAKVETNKNRDWLKPFVQYGGGISDLRGEGSLIAYLHPTLLTGGAPLSRGGKGGQMVLEWAYHWSQKNSFLCVLK